MNRFHESFQKQVSQVPEEAGVPAGGRVPLAGSWAGETI